MSQQRVLKQINERIKQSQKQGEIIWLQLDSIPIRQFTKETKALLEAYPSLEYLTLNDCELNSLNNFPKLDNLSVLQLSNNKIQDDELFHLLKNSHISHLMIDQNRLKSIQNVSILRQLSNLQQLEIAGNRIGESDFYREELFDRIPQLKIIDCHDRYGNIAIDSQSQSESDGDSIKAINKQQQTNPSCNHTSSQKQKSLLDFLNEDQSLPEEDNDDKVQLNQQSLNKVSYIKNVAGSKKRKLDGQEIKNSRIEQQKTSALYQESNTTKPNFIQHHQCD